MLRSTNESVSSESGMAKSLHGRLGVCVCVCLYERVCRRLSHSKRICLVNFELLLVFATFRCVTNGRQ